MDGNFQEPPSFVKSKKHSHVKKEDLLQSDITAFVMEQPNFYVKYAKTWDLNHLYNP